MWHKPIIAKYFNSSRITTITKSLPSMSANLNKLSTPSSPEIHPWSSSTPKSLPNSGISVTRRSMEPPRSGLSLLLSSGLRAFLRKISGRLRVNWQLVEWSQIEGEISRKVWVSIMMTWDYYLFPSTLLCQQNQEPHKNSTPVWVGNLTTRAQWVQEQEECRTADGFRTDQVEYLQMSLQREKTVVLWNLLSS